MNYNLKRNPMTFFLLSITVLVFLSMQLVYGKFASSSQAVYQFGGMFGILVRTDFNQLWRLVTPIFVHIGWEHFLVNSFTLFFVGQLAESIWGSKNFLLLYILSGIMGNIFTLQLTPNVIAAGASTSLFGLFAAITVLGVFGKNPLIKSMGKNYQALIVINLIMNLFMPNVGIVGHLGGLIGGALGAVFLANNLEKTLFSKRKD
ncbi:rhomboid family intramembrane serine protease [Streptococcus didelphis]|uniref:rhomboid family intramembrane serine protease n=1 Tax=Streptococcus didelphis TaxID=102886 RepID=UPI0027D32825|nr:rhomboid family intramembrane serine protease [Streptococcus didelphis]